MSASTDQDEGVLDELDDTDNGDAPPNTDDADGVDDRHPEAVDLDDPPQPGPGDAQPGDEAEDPDTNAGAKKTALVLGVGLVVAVVAIFAGLTVFSRHDPAARQDAPRARVAAQPTAAPASSAAPPDSDQAVAFTASANCPAGSTSAQALTDTASDSAWVCVRGAPGGQVDGQVLHIDLGRSYLLTAVAITPGWVAKTPGGKDEWLAHRVVTAAAVHLQRRRAHHFHPGHRQHPRPGDHAVAEEGARLAGHGDHLANVTPAGLAAAQQGPVGAGAAGIPRLGAGRRRRPSPRGCHPDQPAQPDG